MRANDLRNLIDRLHRLQQALREVPESRELGSDDFLAQEASACELMLPFNLTAATLKEAVDRKLNTAAVLLKRAAAHEELAADMQLAADEGYMVDEDDLAAGNGSGTAGEARTMSRNDAPTA